MKPFSPLAFIMLLLATPAAADPGAIGTPGGASAKPLFDQLAADSATAPEFSAGGGQRARVSGYVDALAAYTYADPVHWSRAVARLQLAAQGELAPDVRWKIGGRVDVDPVYFGSNFYPDPVNHDQRFDAIWRENYIGWSMGDWDMTVGAQQIVWGEVIGLFFADVVSAREMRDFLLPSFDVIRIPQWAARAEYTTGDNHLELVWIPVPTFDRIGKPGSDFYPVPLPSPLPQDVAALFRDPQRPERTLANSSYGLRANTLVAGWDLAGFYYRSFSTAPTFYRLPGESPAQPFVVQPRYDRIWQGGGTLSKDFGDFVLRAEAVYTNGQNFSTAGTSVADDGVVKRNTFDYIAGLEWSFANDTRLNVQGFQRVYSGGGSGELAIANDGFGMSVFLSTKLNGNVEPQFLWMRNLRDGGSMLRPRVNWNVAPNVLLSLGADIFTGAQDTFFGRYNNRDRLYSEMRYDF